MKPTNVAALIPFNRALAFFLALATLTPENQSWAEIFEFKPAGKLVADDAHANDWLGISPKFTDDGQFLIVGATGHDRADGRRASVNNQVYGAVYIFQRDPSEPGGWKQFQKLRPDDLGELTSTGNLQGDGFGLVIDTAQDLIAVVSRPGAGFTSDTGAVYLFQRNLDSGHWEQIKNFRSPANDPMDRYGGDVDLAEEFLLVGARDAEEGRGVVYFYERDQGGPDNWGLARTLRAPDANPGDQFGHAASLQGDTLLIGARSDDELGVNAGAVYVFDRNAGAPNNWGLVKKILAPDGAAGDAFGGNAALDGDRMLVGAPTADDKGTDSGAAYLFERNRGGPDNWGFLTKLLAGDGEPNDRFGANLHLAGETAFVTAWGGFGDGDVQKKGAVYVFKEGGTLRGGWGQTQKLESSDPSPTGNPLTFGCCWGPDLHNRMLAVGAILAEPEGQSVTFNSGAVYLFERVQAPDLSDNFDNNDPTTPILWSGPNGGGSQYGQPIHETNGQLVLQGNFPRTNRDSIARTFTAWGASGDNFSLPDGYTLDVSVDLIRANQNNALAVVGVEVDGGGYVFFKDEDEIGLGKYGSGFSTFLFWEEHILKNDNVTLLLSLSLKGSQLHLRTRVLEIDNADQALFDRTIVDNLGVVDPTMPNRSVKGLRFQPDTSNDTFQPPPVNETGVYLALWWVNPDAPPQGETAEVILDNFEVYQYESPILMTIERAVLLTWPSSDTVYTVEGAASVDGPWELIDGVIIEDLENGLNQMTIGEENSLHMKVFRLVEPENR